jgi:hypothetical protein
MINRIVLAALCVVALSVNAESRPRHRVAAPTPACTDSVMRPCYATPPADLKEARRIARGQYIADQLGYGGVADNPVPRATRGRKARQVQSYGVPSPSFGYSIARPVRYIAGRLVCSINVNSALAERGIRGTGSALAKSFLSWGRASAPVPGAVAVSSRRGGGHVAIVKEVRPDGTIIVFNPSPRGRGWQEVAYRHRAISFRVPG